MPSSGPHVLAGPPAVPQKWRKDAKQQAEEVGHLGPFLNPSSAKQCFDMWSFYTTCNMLHGCKQRLWVSFSLKARKNKAKQFTCKSRQKSSRFWHFRKEAAINSIN